MRNLFGKRKWFFLFASPADCSVGDKRRRFQRETTKAQEAVAKGAAGHNYAGGLLKGEKP